MTVSDMWTRTYSLFTGAPGVTRHIYLWSAETSPPYLELAPRSNSHPLAPYSPPAAMQETLSVAFDVVTGSAAEGVVYQRITGVPTAGDYGWDMSTWACEEVLLACNASVYSGEEVDGNGIPLVWQFGGADFSTPFPSWVFTEQPTHFRLTLGQFTARSRVVMALLSHTAETLVAASLERSEQAHIYTTQGGFFSTNFGPLQIPRIKGNGGPIGSRHTPWDLWSDTAGANRPTIVRNSANGDLVGGFSRGMRQRGVNATDSEYPASYSRVRYVNHHFATLPTFRYRAWGVGSDTDEGFWSFQHIGVQGDSLYDSRPFYPTVTDTGYATLVAYDDTLDMNTVDVPAGTLYTIVTVTNNSYYTEENAVLEGPEQPFFADSGSRSDVGGSVYIPGRVLKLGNVTDAGVAT